MPCLAGAEAGLASLVCSVSVPSAHKEAKMLHDLVLAQLFLVVVLGIVTGVIGQWVRENR